MLDADALVRRVESTSFIAELPDPERQRVLTEARRIAADTPAPFPFPYATEVEIFERP